VNELERLVRALARPIVWLPPLTVVGAAITFGKMFGCVGVLLALPVGTALGIGMVWFWYAYVVADRSDREEAFRDRVMRDLRGVRRLGRGPGRLVEPIAFDGSFPPPAPARHATAQPDSLRDMETRATSDPAGALAEIEALAIAQPRSAPIAALRARTLLAAGRVSEACGAASEAVQMAVLVGDVDTATTTMVALWSRRESVSLDPATVLELGRAFVDRSDLRRAAWCADRARMLGGDLPRARALLVTAAERGEGAGEDDLAARLYAHALELDPSSSDAANLRERVARLRDPKQR